MVVYTTITLQGSTVVEEAEAFEFEWEYIEDEETTAEVQADQGSHAAA